MGSKAIQAKLWGKSLADWAKIQEPTGIAGYNYVLDYLKSVNRLWLLDVGCGSGIFSDLANGKGAEVTGIDASDKMIEEAKLRNPDISFLTSEMEELPYEDELFDVVCALNSIQYAADTKNALATILILKPGKRFVICRARGRGN